MYAFLGGFHAQKAFASGDRLLPKKSTFVFGLNFLPVGASSPFVTPISGYAYVRVSNNKQQITPGEFKRYKTN